MPCAGRISAVGRRRREGVRRRRAVALGENDVLLGAGGTAFGGGIEMPDTDTTEAVEALVTGLGEVHGRKKLQKIAFLLQSFGVPLPQRFFFHF